jgi:hypothetical protein
MYTVRHETIRDSRIRIFYNEYYYPVTHFTTRKRHRGFQARQQSGMDDEKLGGGTRTIQQGLADNQGTRVEGYPVRDSWYTYLGQNSRGGHFVHNNHNLDEQTIFG